MFSDNSYINFHAHNQEAVKGGVVIQSKFLQDDLITQQSDKIFFTSGLHPWYADKLDVSEINIILEKLIKSKSIIAIGETGIDKLKGPEMGIQTKVFKVHIEIAEKYGLPLVVHSVKAHNEVLKVKIESQSKIPWVIHNFNGSKQMAFDLINHGFYLSLSYHINNIHNRLSGYLNDLPIDRLFLETDDFDIDIRDLYKTFSVKCNISVDKLKKQLIKNLNTFVHGK